MPKKHTKLNKQGFTLVELMVVLAITAILAALVGGGLIAYTRLARFEQNEANARTIFQTAQIALTNKETSGQLDSFRAQVSELGIQGSHFDEEQYGDKTKEYNASIYALYYDKNDPDSPLSQLTKALLEPYCYDESLLAASLCVEVDSRSGQVFSAFYDTTAPALRFAGDAGAESATDITDRSYSYRRNDSLVGYYSAEDTVNVVELQQTKLKVKNPRLSNAETLTLSWSSNSRYNDVDTVYTLTAYAAKQTLGVYSIADEEKPLFSIKLVWENVARDGTGQAMAELPVTYYDANGQAITKDAQNRPLPEKLTFPLSYNKGTFVLTLDAMADAATLQASDGNLDVAASSLYSITRLVEAPQDIIMQVKAEPNTGYEDSYIPSKAESTNAENTLFALGGTAKDGADLKFYRHLYNLRWADDFTSADDHPIYTLEAQSMGSSGLNWTGGSVTVYTAAATSDDPTRKPEAKVPSAENPVAWPTIPHLSENITLTSETTGIGAGTTSRVPLLNLQLRSSSVAKEGPDGVEELRAHYVGLIGENAGTIRYLTLRDADVLVNAEVKTVSGSALPEGAVQLTDSTALVPLDADDADARPALRAVGALCGVSTGTIEHCTLVQGAGRNASARVLAALSFDDTTVRTDRQENTTGGESYIENEPRGIGGLVGFAMPDSGAKLTDLTVGANVKVAGVLTDASAAANPGDDTENNSQEALEKTRYAQAAAEPVTELADGASQTTLWRSVGVGGVFGTLDATNLTADAATGIVNNAAVTGSAFTGGLAGNLYSTAPAGADSSRAVTLTGLVNNGTVTAGIDYEGGTAGRSRVLGQFFGGLAGYSYNVTFTACSSVSNSSLSEADLLRLVQAGYNADGTLNSASPLRGDFVGGLVGYGNSIGLVNCSGGKGYLLGSRFVGGFAGGLTGTGGGAVLAGGTNEGSVFGNRYVGGIVSVNAGGTVIRAMTNKGLVGGLGANAAYVGGIAGRSDAGWGTRSGEAAEEAVLEDCVNNTTLDTATDDRRVALLKSLSTYGSGVHYADYVGGLTGWNGTQSEIRWTADGTPKLGVLLYGRNFVGGIAGYNAPDAQITNANSQTLPITITGQVVATGDAAGGAIGMNTAARLPSINSAITLVQGVHAVGGVIGANLPVQSFAVGTEDNAGILSTAGSTGRVVADGLAGGIIGYNRLLESLPDADPAALLPQVGSDGTVTAGEGTTSGGAITLSGWTNTLNLNANAYLGGILGYNDPATRLTLSGAVNGSAASAAESGGLSMGSGGVLYDGVALGTGFDAADRGSYAGGIIGYATANTTLENCTNYGAVSHRKAAGGIAGRSDGTIKNCTSQASLGSRQSGYSWLGGIAGINAGTITDSYPAQGRTIYGGNAVGGVAGVNLSAGRVELTAAPAASAVSANSEAGGIAGVNRGSIRINATVTLTVTVTADTNAGGIAGSNETGVSVSGGTTGAEVNAGTNAGGAVGYNRGSVLNVTNVAAVSASDSYAGGIAGVNAGTLTGCRHTGGTVYTANSYAGGMAGRNEANATISSAKLTAGAVIRAANGAAGGIAAENLGTIEGGDLTGAAIEGTAESMGAAAAYNKASGTIKDLTLEPDAKIRLQGRATHVGGLVGTNEGDLTDCTVHNGSLDLSGLTAASGSVTFGGAIGRNAATDGHKAQNLTVQLDVTDKLEKYGNLGGVAGQNDGALLKCSYTGTLGLTSANADGSYAAGAASRNGDTIGGIAGINNGTVEGCTVPAIVLQARGVNNVSSLQTDAQKLDNATHVGGIAGRNNGTIRASFVATEKTGKSIIAARYGFVGGVAGSNSGTITGSGSQQAQALVTRVNTTWLPLNTADANTGINAMVAELTDANSSYAAYKGVDTVAAKGYGYASVYLTENKTTTNATGSTTTKAGLAANDLTVVLRGSNSRTAKDNDETQRGSGYLGGITGYNSVAGEITDSATGHWFVYGDNISRSSTIGGIVGTNISSKDLTTLVNCAAVRRYSRIHFNYDDDNTRNDNTGDQTTRMEVHVGGIIGHQNNDRDDQWTLSKCINYGSVYNSRANNIGGIVSYWTNYGGTIQYSFNFGNLQTNMNDGKGDCGTMGGIAGYFDEPISNTSVNILHCQNHGTMEGTNNDKPVNGRTAANDCAGIFGKVQMASSRINDPMTINIFDCVNGSTAAIRTCSMSAGIFCYLGPWKEDANNKYSVPNVSVNIERCRNYSLNMEAGRFIAGIAGNRGAGGTSNEPTVVNNCFSLVKDSQNYGEPDPSSSRKYHPLSFNHYNRKSIENTEGSNNYYLDDRSFKAANGRASNLSLTHSDSGLFAFPSSTAQEYFREIKETVKIDGHRLNAGRDSADSEYPYFAMLATQNNDNDNATYDVSNVNTNNAYIKVDSTNTWNREVCTNNGQVLGQVLIRFKERSGDNQPGLNDIRDEDIQNYYKYVLDAYEPDQIPNSIEIKRSDETSGTETVYGRYTVKWEAPAQSETHGPAMYYKLEVYSCEADGKVKEGATPLHTAMVYETKYTFDNDPTRNNWTGNFIVRITPVNSKGDGKARDSAVQVFAQSLPKPQLEVRLKRTGWTNMYYQYLVLTNYDEYVKLADDQWQVNVTIKGSGNFDFTKDKSEVSFANGLDTTTTMTATAEPKGDDVPFMRSALYSVDLAVPGPFTNPEQNDEWNTGLAAKGNLTISDPKATGTTVSDLQISVEMSYKPFVRADNKMQDVEPIYRVMLVGQYVGDETINGTSLKGQYITLASQQARIGSTTTTVTLKDLPKEAFTSDYTNLQIIAAPVESGLGPVYSRWAATESEVTAAIATRGTTNPIAYYDGLEIVRKGNGSYEYAHMTALYLVGKVYSGDWAHRDDSYNDVLGPTQVQTRGTGVATLQAPTLDEPPVKGEVRTENNKLYYTFGWTQTTNGTTPDTEKRDYTIGLYGVQADGSEESIQLKTGFDLTQHITFDGKGHYTLELCVDDAIGVEKWRYDAVRLYVARKADTTSATAQIGIADECTYQVLRRLATPVAPSNLSRTDNNNANGLYYKVSWGANGTDEYLANYTLYAEYGEGDQTVQVALGTTKGTETSLTVDLEKYQGKTLKFYVVANSIDQTKRWSSADSDRAAETTIITRLAAPTVNGMSYGIEAPSQTQFLSQQSVKLTLADNADDGSYYFTGYLLPTADAYDAVVAAVKAWQNANADGKAAAFATLQETIANNGGLLLTSTQSVGAQANYDAASHTVSYDLSGQFTMLPKYAGYYLLPAVRIMSQDAASADSGWSYCTADANTAKLPLLKLDAPDMSNFTKVTRENETVKLFGTNGAAWNPAEKTDVSVSRYGVEWAAVNNYTEDNGTATNLANAYSVTITPAGENAEPYTVTFTVADRDIYAKGEDGNIVTDENGEPVVATPRGAILKVEKTIGGQTFEIAAGEDQTYDLSLVPVEKRDDEGNPVLDENGNQVYYYEPKHETLTGNIKVGEDNPNFEYESYTMLEAITTADGTPGYRITLPDLTDAIGNETSLAKFTNSVSVKATGAAETTVRRSKVGAHRRWYVRPVAGRGPRRGGGGDSARRGDGGNSAR